MGVVSLPYEGFTIFRGWGNCGGLHLARVGVKMDAIISSWAHLLVLQCFVLHTG